MSVGRDRAGCLISVQLVNLWGLRSSMLRWHLCDNSWIRTDYLPVSSPSHLLLCHGPISFVCIQISFLFPQYKEIWKMNTDQKLSQSAILKVKAARLVEVSRLFWENAEDKTDWCLFASRLPQKNFRSVKMRGKWEKKCNREWHHNNSAKMRTSSDVTHHACIYLMSKYCIKSRKKIKNTKLSNYRSAWVSRRIRENYFVTVFTLFWCWNISNNFG